MTKEEKLDRLTTLHAAFELSFCSSQNHFFDCNSLLKNNESTPL